jgi:threonine/homoserine/homoserine lactone efflux protein
VTIFDVLLLLAVLAAVSSLAVAAVLALAQRRSASLRLLRRLAFSVVGYVLLGLAVSLVRPRRVLSVGEGSCPS